MNILPFQIEHQNCDLSWQSLLISIFAINNQTICLMTKAKNRVAFTRDKRQSIKDLMEITIFTIHTNPPTILASESDDRVRRSLECVYLFKETVKQVTMQTVCVER